MTTSQDLVDRSVAALTATPTDAAARVYSPGDWPTWDRQYPVIKVNAPRERKRSLGKGAREFVVVATIRFVARVEVPAATDDGGAGAAEAQLARLKQQIEQTIINHPTIDALLEEYPSVVSEIGFSSDGEQHLAELVLDIEMQFYQGPEDFYVPPVVPLKDLRIQSALPDPASPGGQLPGPILDVQPSS